MIVAQPLSDEQIENVEFRGIGYPTTRFVATIRQLQQERDEAQRELINSTDRKLGAARAFQLVVRQRDEAAWLLEEVRHPRPGYSHTIASDLTRRIDAFLRELEKP